MPLIEIGAVPSFSICSPHNTARDAGGRVIGVGCGTQSYVVAGFELRPVGFVTAIYGIIAAFLGHDILECDRSVFAAGHDCPLLKKHEHRGWPRTAFYRRLLPQHRLGVLGSQRGVGEEQVAVKHNQQGFFTDAT